MIRTKRKPAYVIEVGDGFGPFRWWYWHLKAANNEILCHSETYRSRSNCLRAIRAHRRAAATAVVRER